MHEFGKDISKTVLSKAGAEVFDLGMNVPVDEIADTVIETGSRSVLITTCNGIALSFAKALMIR